MSRSRFSGGAKIASPGVAGRELQARYEDVAGAAMLAHAARARERFDPVLVSPGVSAGEAQRIGLGSAPTVRGALDRAFERQGRDALVAVLRYGGRLLPRIADA